MKLGKAWSSEHKLLAMACGLAMVGLVLTYWQIHSLSIADTSKTAFNSPKGYEFIEVAPPPGNIFIEGRRIASRDKNKDEEARPPKEATTSDFVLASIIERGHKSIAIFIADNKRISLSPGQQDPLIGKLILLRGNQATTSLADGTEKQWKLFPISNPGKPNKEETPSS
ncbi:hypothetical protein [Salinivibrio sp. ES.052]|uniref:hypothetical protein n=1 Tax=Salinivibrio sp. ES.052 TaxID=1882823 RepID=UPI00092A21C8|nr:hypothetical protein [Salinivibrio sp. ES.052]SIN79598.1 hypothetical protein SAMN05444724_0506 [Salinivibrio sp. ES.052]